MNLTTKLGVAMAAMALASCGGKNTNNSADMNAGADLNSSATDMNATDMNAGGMSDMNALGNADLNAGGAMNGTAAGSGNAGAAVTNNSM